MLECRAVFISDVHLGHTEAKVDELVQFLENVKAEYLYVVGDLVDFFHLYDHRGWAMQCNRLIKKLFGKIQKRTKVRICIGNHDAFLGILDGFEFGNIQFADEFIHEGVRTNYLVLHGDKFDKSLSWFRLAWWAAIIQCHFSWLPFFKRVRGIIHCACERSMSYTNLFKYAEKHNLSKVVMGHTHFPWVSEKIYNCGDWVENKTAIVEMADGEMQLIRFDEFIKEHGVSEEEKI